MKKSFVKRSRKKSKGFNPNHDFIKNAQEEFFQRGGHVTFVKVDDNQLQEFTNKPDKFSYADEFLMENGSAGDIPIS